MRGSRSGEKLQAGKVCLGSIAEPRRRGRLGGEGSRAACACWRALRMWTERTSQAHPMGCPHSNHSPAPLVKRTQLYSRGKVPSPKGAAPASQGFARNESGGEDKKTKEKSAGASGNFFIPDERAEWEGKPSTPPLRKGGPQKGSLSAMCIMV